MPNQKSNAANEGDVMKHPPLHNVVQHRSKINGKDEFWYVETHTGAPYYFLPSQGSWQAGIGHLDQSTNQLPAPPTLLKDYANFGYHDKQNVYPRFPDKRTYLGSAAQVFHLLKEKKKRVRMTLFELKSNPAQELFRYFQSQGAKAVLVRTGRGAGHVDGFMRQWWDAAVANTQRDDFVMIVQGDSYKLAPALWTGRVNGTPDLVFIDPFKIGDSGGQPQGILTSLSGASVPFICWSPLFSVPRTSGQRWQANKWSFEGGQAAAGDEKSHAFFVDRISQNHQVACFSWAGSNGARQKMYGCQLTFGNVFGTHFTPASIWQFPNGLPYIDLMNFVANPGQQGPNFHNPITTRQTPGQALNAQALPIPAGKQPGVQWWDKYHAAFWWP